MQAQMQMMKIFAAMIIMTVVVSIVAAADPPAPAPTSDATSVFVPIMVASLSSFVLAIFF